MGRDYNPDIRKNNPLYLVRQAQELLNISQSHNNASSLIYACLDLRIALEILDLHTILTSVGNDDRILLIEDSKPKNGIDKIGRKRGVLKERYQLFFQAICEVVGVEGKSFDFKNSKDLQYHLSSYIHSYYMTDDDLKYDSLIMQSAREVINRVITFIKNSLNYTQTSGYVVGLEISTLPEEDKLLLDEWKNTPNMDYEYLKSKIAENVKNRDK